jgi:hypothetical protein
MVDLKPKWVTQAASAARQKLALSNTGSGTPYHRLSNTNSRNEQWMAAPGSGAGFDSARARSSAVEEPGASASPRRDVYDTTVSQSSHVQVTTRSRGPLKAAARHRTPEILKLPEQYGTATSIHARPQLPVSIGAPSPAKLADKRTHEQNGGKDSASLAGPLRYERVRGTSVTMGPLQKLPGDRPASPGAEREGNARRAAPGPAEVPPKRHSSLEEAASRPDRAMIAPPGAGPMRVQSLGVPTIRLAPYSAAACRQTPSAPFEVGQDKLVQSTGLLGEGAMLGFGSLGTTGSSRPDTPQALASTEGGDFSTSPSPKAAPTEGDVYLDGTLVGRWMARTLTQAAERQPISGAAFDPTRNRLPVGTMIGV